MNKSKRSFLLFPEFKNKAVTLSYDDGTVCDKELLAIVNKYHMKVTFNISSGKFAEEGAENAWYLSASEALKAYAGHEIAVHGQMHLSLTDVPASQATQDILLDRLALEKLSGKIVRGMAYANGAVDDTTVEIVKNCGICYARTTVATGKFDIPCDWLRMPSTCHHNAPELMQLVDDFLAPVTSSYPWAHKPRLFYLWGHSHEYHNNNNWIILEKFCNAISGKEDVWYATNGEIYDYVTAFDNLVYSANGRIVYNPTNTVLYFNNILNGYKYMIKPGETVDVYKS